ncbi:MAG TPA: Smr/MutS family protein [Thermoanaerobaculia bacterium]|nr:Smr/MutS family protein [Thermoanaerobaculia bacterium]
MVDADSWRALEVDRVLGIVARCASSDLGATIVRRLRPIRDPDALAAAQELQRQADRRLAGGHTLAPALGEPVAELLERVGASVSTSSDSTSSDSIEPVWLIRLASALDAACSAVAAAHDVAGELPELAAIAEGVGRDTVRDLRQSVEKIRRILDARGEVRADASPRLERLRAKARELRDELYGSFERYVEDHRDVLGEETISQREGRLAVLLPAGHRGRLDGLVHARSATGRSYYFEPLELVDRNNDLQGTLADEDAERHRLLAELERRVREQAREIAEVFAVYARLDALQAAHRFAAALDGVLPEIVEEPPRLLQARHPLLDPAVAALREAELGIAGNRRAVVPIDLDFDEDRVLVVTGPNAGGKTVTLKTLGLLCVLAQCGLPVPAASGTRLPRLERLVAVVGDEQNMLADRSTFSAHLQRWRDAWQAAGPGSLVLIDELGSGTDPREGAALALALLESLSERGGLALFTTHLIEVAAAAYRLEGARCLAMEFDPETSRPTFRPRSGPPGGSEALSLARRLGLPEEWLGRAEALLGTEQRDLRRLIEEAEELRGTLERERAHLESLRLDQETLNRRLAEELSEQERERKALRRSVEAELVTFRRQVRQRLGEEARRLRAAADTASESPRRATEKAEARILEGAPRPPEPLVLRDDLGAIEVGDQVRHATLGWSGRVERLDGERAVVAVRGKRVTCGRGELAAIASPRPSPAPRSSEQARGGGGVATPETPDVPLELNLVGQRVAPALDRLDDYLDRALRANVEQVRVIHGHGSGALRRAVREHLAGHPAAAGFEAAAPEEGGDGATRVTLAGS